MFRSSSPALKFKVVAKCPVTRARVSQMELPHFTAETPMFMPVGTKGTIKGLISDQIEFLDCHVILGNTYHLSLKPGEALLNEMKGLHTWMGWNRGLLTDSGGFQMVSLMKLSNVTEEGVKFSSPYQDGSRILLTPEKSIEIQNSIGADIIMQLDDVVNPLSSRERIEEAMWRSIRWLDRCIRAHSHPESQNLFPIIQGGLHYDLREKCIEETVKRNAPGYAIGGLSGGEDKNQFWRIILFCTNLLPENKPRYCMGIGYALDLVVCAALGADMFDCVFPTRTARFGNALVPSGSVSLRNAKYKDDFNPIDSECSCYTCKNYSRSYLHMIMTKETTGCHLITIHNIAYQMSLMKKMRQSIINERFPEFVVQFCKTMFGENTPPWAKDAFASVGIII